MRVDVVDVPPPLMTRRCKVGDSIIVIRGVYCGKTGSNYYWRSMDSSNMDDPQHILQETTIRKAFRGVSSFLTDESLELSPYVQPLNFRKRAAWYLLFVGT